MLTLGQAIYCAVVAGLVGGGLGVWLTARRRGTRVWDEDDARQRVRAWTRGAPARLIVVGRWARRRWQVVLGGGVVLLLAYSYAVYQPPPAAPPVTVVSAETFVDVTLSNGRRVHNTALDAVAYQVVKQSAYDTRDANYLACMQGQLNAYAQTVVVGREVTGVTTTTTPLGYGTVNPLTGYSRASLSFFDGTSSYADLSSEFRQAQYSAETACYVPPPTPTYTPMPEPAPVARTPSNTEVYVDSDDRDDGESRFCRKRRWC